MPLKGTDQLGGGGGQQCLQDDERQQPSNLKYPQLVHQGSVLKISVNVSVPEHVQSAFPLPQLQSFPTHQAFELPEPTVAFSGRSTAFLHYFPIRLVVCNLIVLPFSLSYKHTYLLSC